MSDRVCVTLPCSMDRNYPSNAKLGAMDLISPNSGAKLHVTDSVVTNNGTASSGGSGILIQPTGSGSAAVVIDHTRVENNTHGIVADGTRIVVEAPATDGNGTFACCTTPVESVTAISIGS